MIRGINNISFSANIVHNDLLESAINTSKFDSESPNFQNRMLSVQFSNALEYLKNDGTNDVYVVSKNADDEGVSLLKNDEVVKSISSYANDDKNIFDLFSGYIQKDLNYPLHKDTIDFIRPQLSLNMIKNRIMDMSKELDSMASDLKIIEKGLVSANSKQTKDKLDMIV